MYSDDLKTMQKPQLIDEARQFGIEVGPKDTKARLIEKIEKAYYMTEEGKKELKELVPAPVPREDTRQKVHFRANDPIGIDSVIKSEDIDNEILRTTHDLQASVDSSIKQILTAQIRGTQLVNLNKLDENGVPIQAVAAIANFNNRIITIPLKYYFLPHRTKGRCSEYSVDEMDLKTQRRFIEKRFFSEIDFTVDDMEDSDFGIVVGNRVLAAERKQKNWNKKVKNEKGEEVFLLRKDAVVEARIISVVPYGIFIEVFGYEFYVPRNELSYKQRFIPSTTFKNGERIMLKLTDVQRDEKTEEFQSASFSFKATFNDPSPEIVKHLPDSWSGEVVDKTYDSKIGYRFYVVFNEYIDACCEVSKAVSCRPNVGDKVSYRITDSIVKDGRGQIRGVITHIE